MSRKYYCAKCGLKLEVIQKANPKEGIVMNLVEPHECKEISSLDAIEEDRLIEEIETSGENKNINDLFDKSSGAFKILDKENEKKLDKTEHEVVTQESGDKREKEHLRKELVTSSAPLNVLGMAARSEVYL